MIAVEGLVIALVSILFLQSFIFFTQCMIAILPGRVPVELSDDTPLRIALLVPAHNEELMIQRTVQGLLKEIDAKDRLIVIADNCSDRTAEIAKIAGATVIERHDTEQRGKGYALSYGLDYLEQDPPDVVVIVDADSEVSQGTIQRIARRAIHAQRPVQAEYLITSPEKPTSLSRVSAFAFLVRNKIRPLGMWRIGLPCQLTGSGMAFPWKIIRSAPPTTDCIVEDLLMGLDLAKLGYPPLFGGEGHIRSILPERYDATVSQRKRWEHGQMATMLNHSIKLIVSGVVRFRLSLLSLGLDLAVPPLSFLVGSIFLSCIVAALSLFLGFSSIALLLAFSSLILVGVAVVGSWIKFGIKILPPKHLITIPFYILWKIPIYFSFIFRGKQKQWERTDRRSS